MRSNETYLHYTFLIVNFCYDAVRVMHDLKTGPVVFDKPAKKKVAKKAAKAKNTNRLRTANNELWTVNRPQSSATKSGVNFNFREPHSPLTIDHAQSPVNYELQTDQLTNWITQNCQLAPINTLFTWDFP